jgi:small subunit ribosomal protein S1
MIKNRDRVYDKAEEMAAKYREHMRARQQGNSVQPAVTVEVPVAVAVGAEDLDIPEDLELPPATED